MEQNQQQYTTVSELCMQKNRPDLTQFRENSFLQRQAFQESTPVPSRHSCTSKY